MVIILEVFWGIRVIFFIRFGEYPTHVNINRRKIWLMRKKRRGMSNLSLGCDNSLK